MNRYTEASERRSACQPGQHVLGRRAVAAISVIAAVLAVCAVGYAFTADGHNDHVRGVVLFVGDSNITLGAATIDWDLTWKSHNDNGYVPVLAARVGAGIRTLDCIDPTGCTTYDYWQVKLAELSSKVQPDAIVNNLGINDAISPGTLATTGYASYGKKIDWFMSLVPPTIPVLWTNLPCMIEPPGRPGCPQINYQLSLATTRWPNLVVVDWASVARSHLEYMLDPTSVHLSDAGQQAWADTVTAALDARFPG